jgi:sugar-specific transcriptional regulator TrmB
MLKKEWMLKTMDSLGFKQKDAQVYVYLALNGPKRAKDIAEAMNTYKLQVYRSLKKLKSKEVVNATSSFPAEFYAISFDRVLDLFMKTATEQAKAFQISKEELLSSWFSMIEKQTATT